MDLATQGTIFVKLGIWFKKFSISVQAEGQREKDADLPTSTVSTPGITLQSTEESSNCIRQGKLENALPCRIFTFCKFINWCFQLISQISDHLCFILHKGFASAQRVIQLNYCSIDEHNLRMDCKYALPSEAPEPFCKYTHGERLFDTTDPEEEQHAPFKKRAKARIFPGNVCRLLFKNLPNGKSNFTCNIKYADSTTATKTSVVEKKLLLPCSTWSVLLQSCSGLLLTLMTLPMLLEIHWL
ncbi:thy-1 membrane glycoprotein-like [Pempheris klunzingeri]|uniref:thy-1 membrane glycoprotein-like n=1 Tax=Pempheris klunzingeri TaxID=3127111 RepID=UPI0039807C94